MFSPQPRLARWLGLSSLALSLLPVDYIFHPTHYPSTAVTEVILVEWLVLTSFVLAVAAGIVGSRWWFVALVGAIGDAACMFLFNP